MWKFEIARKISRSRSRADLKSDLLGKNLPLLPVVVIFLITAFLIFYSISKPSVSPTTTTTSIVTTTLPTIPSPTTTLQTAKGTLIVALKDEEHKLPGGAVVKSLNFTVTGIEVYKNETAEWTSMFEGNKTFDLLKYTTTYAKIVEKEIDAGSYDKIKLLLSDGKVSIVHTVVGIWKPKVYDLSVQKETTVSHDFSVTDGGTLTLVLDFDVENSVKRIGEGYALTPVIAVSEQVGRATNMEEV